MTKAKKITCTAVFAAIAIIMMYFEFPIPFMPPFLKVDLSGAVVLVGAFILGIAPAITMIGIKDLIHLTQTQTAGSGEAADFLMLSTLVIIAVLVYRAHKSRKMAVTGCAVGSVAMACMGMLTNYFLIIPFYVNGMGWNLDAIFELCSAVNPSITGMGMYLLLGVLPFNLIKGAILTVITMLAYKKLSVFIKTSRSSSIIPPAGRIRKSERSPDKTAALFLLPVSNAKIIFLKLCLTFNDHFDRIDE